MADPVITIHGPDFTELGYLGDPINLAGSLRHNQISSLAVTIPTGHHLAGVLTTPGNRITVDDGEQIFSGPMRNFRVAGGEEGAITAQFESDFRLLHRLLAWPVPESPITNQTARDYDRVTAPVETVLKSILTRNLARPQWQGAPIIVAPDLGRGPSRTVINRFHPIAERTLPVVDAAGLGVSVRQVDAGLVVDVYETSTFPTELVAGETGAITDWEATLDGPTCTDVVVGGQGEGKARTFISKRDQALEAEWGDRIETFTDARQTETAQDLQDSATETLAEGAPRAGIRVTLIDTPEFRFGALGARLGDMVTIRTGTIVRTDRLREVTASWTPSEGDGGWRLIPVAGEVSGSVTKTLIRQIRSLTRRQSQQSNR